MSERRLTPWERPHLLSVSVPVVEELLAESYRRKAEMWADAARDLRAQPKGVSDGASASEPTAR